MKRPERGRQRPTDKLPQTQTQPQTDKLHIFQHAVYKQGILALCTILLMVVLIFAMTTAWYSNVAQTGGLVFETATWGFSGSIELSEEAISAAPGQSGVIPFTITNDSDQSVSMVVTASKSQMSEELQKRLYLYVDTSLKKNNEMMQRVYLSTTGGYTYILGANETLTVTSESYNEAPVCWEWVYDMLGYYVQGRPNADGTSVVVESYLRPIEYDYDRATFDEDGNLLTVDGTTTAAEFLTELSQTDGYEGTITTETSCGGYYPVAVDEEGYGVWAYLCTFSEIERGIAYDTEFSQKSEEERSFTALLSFTAQNLPSNVVSVGSAEDLQSALTDTEADTILLEQDLELAEPLTLPADSSAVLNLNGHTLSGAGTTIFTVYANANLSLSNGTLQGTAGSGQVAIRSIGAVVTLNEIVIEDVDSGVVVLDNLVEGDSRIKIRNSSLTTTKTSLLIQGNGGASDAKTQVIVENTTIDSGYIGISGQGTASGSNQYWGTDIQVIGSSVKGYWAGIYQPQQASTLTVSQGSRIEGYTGLVVKGGEVTVIDSTVLGTGASQAPAAAGGGFTDTGDGVYVEATYAWSASVAIKGDSVITSANRKAVELYTVSDKGPGSIEIYGGTFSPEVTEYWVGLSDSTDE